MLWLIVGFFIAWISEYSSINNGFPYGEYHYVYENLKGEPLLLGVPFFDSLSYVFMTFAGYTMAERILNGKRKIWIIILSAFLTMLLDVMVDPVATMGEKWFLGKIHYYANPGWYFGVPLSNFVGWFLVSLVIIAFNVILWRAFPNLLGERRTTNDERLNMLYPLFYLSIALFITIMAFTIGEYLLALINLAIILVIGFICGNKLFGSQIKD